MAETDQHDRLLSPVRPASKNIPRKPIKPPTITPRRFKKFFNPISTSKIQRNVRTSRKALQEITNPPGKEKHSPVILGLPTHDDDQENASALLNEPRGRKRKLSFASVESPMLSSPLRPEPFFLPSSQDNDRGSEPTRGCSAQSIDLQQEEPDQERGSDNESEDEDEVAPLRVRRPAIRYFNTISKSSSILCSRLSGRGRQKEPRNSKIWQSETATFYSNATDAYFYNSQVFAHPALPFCSASCNSEY